MPRAGAASASLARGGGGERGDAYNYAGLTAAGGGHETGYDTAAAAGAAASGVEDYNRQNSSPR